MLHAETLKAGSGLGTRLHHVYKYVFQAFYQVYFKAFNKKAYSISLTNMSRYFESQTTAAHPKKLMKTATTAVIASAIAG